MDRSRPFCIVLCGLIVLLAGTARAQRDPLEADRPDQTESPAIVPAGWFQLESGWVREAGTGPAEGTIVTSLPALLAKLGLCERLELRLIAERYHLRTEGSTDQVDGLLPIEVGAKLALWNERGVRPRTSVIGHVGIPSTASPGSREDVHFGNMRFTMQHTLSSCFSIGYNLGAEWLDGPFTVVGLYTLTLGAALGERLGCYGELYGFMADGLPPDHRFDAGITFKIGPDVLLDASGGAALGPGGPWSVGAGISFRLPLWGRR